MADNSAADGREPFGPAELLDVAVLDDVPLVLHGVTAILSPFVRRVRAVTSGADPGGPSVDVTLWDPAPRGVLRVGMLPMLLADARHGQIVLHTFAPARQLHAATEGGVAGFVDKGADAEELVRAVLRLATRRPPVVPPSGRAAAHVLARPQGWPGQAHGLSRREAEVVALITRGLTNEDISAATGLTLNTVKSYIRSGYRKLGVQRRSQAVRWGIEHGLLDPGPGG